jgi:uncharacterized protein
MPMATEVFLPDRRAWLARMAAIAALGGIGRLPAAFASQTPPTFAAAWETESGAWRIGLLAPRGRSLTARAQFEVPTRAHGLLLDKNQRLLAAARRPGDWLVRWSPHSGKSAWAWAEPDRVFNGHVIASADGRLLYTTETNLETGAGLIGVRDASSLEKTAEWSSGGMDPHELLLDADGSLLVANGGIPTLPETGRIKVHLDRMDASLARLETTGGELHGQWRLSDPRLSLRHIAWGSAAGQQRVLGIALQAEHADAQRRSAAPVLALFDGQHLRPASLPRSLAGYGGDIAFAGGNFAVSCPRAGGVALYSATGQWQRFVPLDDACPLAATPSVLWAGGRTEAVALAPNEPGSHRLEGLRLDNHWLVSS